MMRTLMLGLALSLGAIGCDTCEGTAGGKCCKICTNGKACGDSCIASNQTCNRTGGCACNGLEVELLLDD